MPVNSVQDEVILITADAPANPRPTKPPTDDPEFTRSQPEPALTVPGWRRF
jgi:hypothetical protein